MFWGLTGVAVLGRVDIWRVQDAVRAAWPHEVLHHTGRSKLVAGHAAAPRKPGHVVRRIGIDNIDQTGGPCQTLAELVNDVVMENMEPGHRKRGGLGRIPGFGVLARRAGDRVDVRMARPNPAEDDTTPERAVARSERHFLTSQLVGQTEARVSEG